MILRWNLGQSAYGLTLSERRASAVRSYLVAQGVDAKRMIYQGYGEVRDEEVVEFVLLDRSVCE